MNCRFYDNTATAYSVVGRDGYLYNCVIDHNKGAHTVYNMLGIYNCTFGDDNKTLNGGDTTVISENNGPVCNTLCLGSVSLKSGSSYALNNCALLTGKSMPAASLRTNCLVMAKADYNLDADETKDFFATVQNMLLFAITGQTAAEIIKSRSDKTKVNMGLTTWEDAPHGKILQADVVISKNYLNEVELDSLNTLVDGFLTLAETRANSQKPTFMKDWKTLLYGYLEWKVKNNTYFYNLENASLYNNIKIIVTFYG